MIIKIKNSTKEGFTTYFTLFYYGVPLVIFLHTGLGWLLGSKILFGVNTVEIAQVSGLIVLFQISWYNKESIFYWFKDWKKRNIKNGVFEI